MTNQQLSDVLDQCLTLMTEKALSVDACLARYPEHAAELRPLLEIVVELRRIPRPEARRAAVDGGKQRMLEAVREREEAARKERLSARNPVGLLARGQAWLDGLLDPLRVPDPSWSTVVATAAVLLMVVIGGGLLLPAWLGATVPRTAHLDALQGRVEVWAADGSAWVPASSDRRLEAGDRVRTLEQGVALLTFFDGSTTALEAGTELTVLELSSRRDGTGKVIVLHQERGQTRHDVRPLRSAEARFQVRTPTALAAVRGTTFDVAVEADGTTNVGLWSGMVEVTWLTEPMADDATVELQPGWFTVVKPDQPPTEPILVPTPLGTERFARLPTAAPTDTPTPTATETPAPTATATVVPSDTPSPTHTASAVPSKPDGEPADEATDTPVPPTDTPMPTDTPVPPTDTPMPTDTPVVPTDTPVPTATPTVPQPPKPKDTATPTATPVPPTPTAPQPPGPKEAATPTP